MTTGMVIVVTWVVMVVMVVVVGGDVTEATGVVIVNIVVDNRCGICK